MNKYRRFGILTIVVVLGILIVIPAFADSENEGNFDISKYDYAQVSVNQGSLNIRKSESTKSLIIGRIPNKSVIVIEAKDSPWCKILYNNMEGFVLTEHLIFIDKLPFEEISKGDSGKHVFEFKNRLKELGYFKDGNNDLNDYFSVTSESRLKILLNNNNLKATNIVTPELQAFIYWGPVKKNKEILPPAPYYVSANTNSSTTLIAGPQGPAGKDGIDGKDGVNGASIISTAFVENDLVFTLTDGSTITLTGAKINLKGDKGDTGPQGPAGVIPPHTHTYSYSGTPISIPKGLNTIRTNMTNPYPYDEADTPLSASFTNLSLNVGPQITVSFKYTISGGIAPYKKDYYIYSPDWSQSFYMSSDPVSNTSSDSVSMTFSPNPLAGPVEGKNFTLTFLVTDSLGTEVSVQKSGAF